MPNQATGVSASAGILLLLALGVGFFGLILLSQATTGVGLLTIACLLAIIARMAQASTHHRELMKREPREP